MFIFIHTINPTPQIDNLWGLINHITYNHTFYKRKNIQKTHNIHNLIMNTFKRTSLQFLIAVKMIPNKEAIQK